MSDFIVSARKYRPSTFSSVVGQKHITSTLKNAIERGQLAHAYLFCGPRGVGKTTCARIFAKAINCLSPHGAEACNECESCRSFNDGRSLNIHELDAASNNSVEDIRTLIEQVRILPQVGRYSVFIIDEVHMLSAAAFNAFLKTLEEPPQHAVFILATTEKHKIIPTILSRCQIYDFNRIRVEDSVDYLRHIAREEGITADEESLNLISQKADGGMRDALSMFDKAVSFCGTTLDYKSVAATLNVLDYDTYFDITRQLSEGNYTDVLVGFDEVLSRGFSGQTFMSGLSRHMRDLLMAKQADTLKLIEMTGTLLERYRAQAGACSVEFLFGAISLLTELDGKIRQSSNQRLLVELGLMKIAGLAQKKNNTAVTEEQYPLPDIDAPRRQADTAPQVAPPTPQPAAAPAPTPAPMPQPSPAQPAPQPAVPPAATPAAAPEQKAAAPAPAPHPTPVTPAATPVERTATPPTPAAPADAPAPRRRKSLITGTSLSELLASANTVEEKTQEETDGDEPVNRDVDPDSYNKLLNARLKFMELIRAKRPRFVQAFEMMEIRDNRIIISVPTSELREEILRNKPAMLRRFCQIADIHGFIDLEVVLNEEIKASRPIKPEDKMKYLLDKNPEIAALSRALHLEME